MSKTILIFYLPVALMFVSCATQQQPQGGARDTIPPKLIRAIPDTFSTNFRSKNISITFDEYFSLKNMNEQLIVSPPLSSVPDIKVKNKTLLIQINDTLKDNTTYTFNFGNAITDANEGNALENFQYVFSTGAAIDTEKISGKVLNALTLEPEKNIRVMLYHLNSDSLPYIDKPTYFGKTSEDGTFVIRNIAHGKYKLFVLKESNNNYLFDSRDESIAFADTLIPSSSEMLTLKLFTEALPQRLLRSYSEEPGKAVLIFQQRVDSLKYKLISPDPGIFSLEYSTMRDTVFLWYKNTSADSLSMKTISPSFSSDDTVSMQLWSLKKIQESKSQKSKREFKLLVSSNLSQAFNLNDTIRLTFSHPLSYAETEKINLIEDSTTLINFTSGFFDALKRRMFIAARWKDDKKYTLEIPPGTFTDTFSLKNDTVKSEFHTRQVKDYGSLKINLKTAGAPSPKILQLMDEKEKVYRQTFFETDTTVTYEYLLPMTYRLKIIEDINKNGKWDTGNYLLHIQPEKVFYNPSKINVRANWDIETDWKIIPGAE